ncbi:MAG: ADOP family duplicated permease, partial [Gemmatimonadota bacterium]|nr:ADOP family duplicated permease [Gemmatimonadota bacterium]
MTADVREIEREIGGQYQIIRTLGRGAFGAVYLARELQLHRVVAIKVVHANRSDRADERARLLREARTLANLSHPAIIPVLAFGETDNLVYMVMPYVGGETLADRLQSGRVDAREARRVLIEVADALAYAHGEGVLHSDLKPENIILERAGAVNDAVPPRVRLIDFGIAGFPTRDPGVGATQEMWGTPQFMAPEQAFGETALDARSEIYSIGVLGYVLLGGRLPFDATSPTQRLIEQKKGPRVPLAMIAQDAPADFVAAIERCIAYEPEARWPRARDLRDALVRGAETPAGAMASLSLIRQRLRGGRGRDARQARAVWIDRADAGRTRAARAARIITDVGADLRFALRMLRKSPGLSAAVIVTLALGVSSTTVVFSAAEALVLRHLPVADPNALVVVQERREGPNQGVTDFGVLTVPYDRYLIYRAAVTPVFTGLAAQEMQAFSLRFGDRARSITGLVTSGNYFEVLGIRPALGRFYTAAWDRSGGGEPSAVIAYDFWRRVFDGDPKAIGRTLYVDSRPMTIVGVAPRGFRGAFGGMFASDVWVPAASYVRAPAAGGNAAVAGRLDLWMIIFGRLRPGVSVERANAMLRMAAPRVPMPDDPKTRAVDAWTMPLSPISAELQGPLVGFMKMLFAVAGVVLLIAVSNTAGMLLARAAMRGREVATRLAVGASRARLVRQLLVESMLLSVVAGALALVLTTSLTRLFNQWQSPFPFAWTIGFGVNGAVLAVAAMIVLGTGIVAGLVPAIQATDVDLAAAMKEGGLQGGPRRSRLRSLFVVAQVALSVMLLAVAGLFARSLTRTLSVDPGFNSAGVIHARLSLEPHGYDGARGRTLFTRLIERLQSRSEIAAAAFASGAPLGGTNISFDDVRSDDRPDDSVSTQWGRADVGFVELLRTPLLAGRTFVAADSAGAVLVTVINETLARRLWPSDSPRQAVGHRILRGGTRLTVVGVIGNGRYTTLQESEHAFAYFPFAQHGTLAPELFLRPRGTTDGALRAAREQLTALDPNIAFEHPTMLDDDVTKWVIPQRTGAFLIGSFALVGLVLAMTGLYGVLAYGVTQRLREFGVRMALGATARDVVRLVARDGVVLVGVGVSLGIAGAFFAGRLIETFLFGLNPADPITLIAVPLLLLVVALLA